MTFKICQGAAPSLICRLALSPRLLQNCFQIMTTSPHDLNKASTYTGHLAFEGFEKDLEKEFELNGIKILEKRENFYLTQDHQKNLIWAQVICRNMQFIKIESIKSAAKTLLAEHRFWALTSTASHRRAQLIEDSLGTKKQRPYEFLKETFNKKYVLWTLWEENLILKGTETNLPTPRGEFIFKESQEPPSRAYLKLWEILTAHIYPPKETEEAIELGASPGGWTWILAHQKIKTEAYDRSPLREDLMSHNKITFKKGDIFKLDPKNFKTITWLFSDVIAYPEKLYDLTIEWLKEKPNLNIVLTIKFQGDTDFKILEKFKKIENSKIIHLYNNKHEVTFLKMNNKDSFRIL